MNKTNTPTERKISLTLRLPPSTYKLLRAKVNEIKENEDLRYSINDFITEAVEKSLKGKTR